MTTDAPMDHSTFINMIKKTALCSLVAAAASTLSVGAHAQSSVTLYGIIDAGLAYTSNVQTGRSNGALHGGSQYSLQDGSTTGVTGSRWGLRGVEDLGGGTSAIFTLENGFGIGTGATAIGGGQFARQAWVGLKSNQYGTVSLGRQYDAIATFVQPLSSVGSWAGIMTGHASDMDNLGNTRRSNNSIRYNSPSYAGFTVGGVYEFGGVAGDTSQRQVYSVGTSFAQGPLALGAAYLNARNPNYSFYGSNANSGTALTSNNLGSIGSATAAEVSPQFAGYASAHTLQIIAVGGSYKLGPATLNLVYTNTQFQQIGNTLSGPNPFGFSGTAKFDNAEAGVSYRLRPDLLVGVVYNYTHGSAATGQASGSVYHQAATGFDYNLSKRTDIYGDVVYLHAGGTDSLNQSAVAAITGQTASASNHQVAVHLSLRQRF